MTDLLLLPGDGIGPEVTAQARRVAEAVAPDLSIAEALFGGCSFDAHGTPLTDEVLAAAKAARAVLMGARIFTLREGVAFTPTVVLQQNAGTAGAEP